METRIKIRREQEHCTIYVDDEFYCTCESRIEVDDEIADIIRGKNFLEVKIKFC